MAEDKAETGLNQLALTGPGLSPSEEAAVKEFTEMYKQARDELGTTALVVANELHWLYDRFPGLGKMMNVSSIAEIVMTTIWALNHGKVQELQQIWHTLKWVLR